MTKEDFVEAICDKMGFSKRRSVELVDLVFNRMKKNLAEGHPIKISGFGNFNLNDKRARRGRNPQTGKAMKISARRVLTFRVSHVLKDTLNGRRKN